MTAQTVGERPGKVTTERRAQDIRTTPSGRLVDEAAMRSYLADIDRRDGPRRVQRLSINDPFCQTVERASRAPRSGHPDLAGAGDGAASRDAGALLEALGTRARASGALAVPPAAGARPPVTPPL